MSKGLIIFAREPVPGKVKTRLAQDIGINAASDLYAAMLGDIARKVSGLEDIKIMLFWATENSRLPAFPGFSQVDHYMQHGSDLGQRMKNAFETAFKNGINTCCIIGSDSPDLPMSFIFQAFQSLEAGCTDIVYGPAEDGGYYLLGMKRLWSRLFDNMSWSDPDVMNATLERIRELSLDSVALPSWHDIDTLADLQRLAGAPIQNAPLTMETMQRLNLFS